MARVKSQPELASTDMSWDRELVARSDTGGQCAEPAPSS
jgi:hypothetical protein